MRTTLFLLLINTHAVAPAELSQESLRANYLRTLAAKHHTRVHLFYLAQLVQTASRLGKTCLPAVFDQKDFLAVALVESSFDPFAVGKAGERGMWQVLEWKHYLDQVDGINPFDVSTNGEMFCHELREKFAKHKSYKKAIVAYNGLGQKGLQYYKKVQQAKKEL